MHFYSTSYEDVLKTPIRTFWSLFGQIRRVRAAANNEHFDLLIAHQSKEGIEAVRDHLKKEIGEPVKKTPQSEFDASGWNDLKRMQFERIG